MSTPQLAPPRFVGEHRWRTIQTNIHRVARLANVCGVRETARRLGINKDTSSKYRRIARERGLIPRDADLDARDWSALEKRPSRRMTPQEVNAMRFGTSYKGRGYAHDLTQDVLPECIDDEWDDFDL